MNLFPGAKKAFVGILQFVMLMLVSTALAHASAPCYVINPANSNNGDGSNWNAATAKGAAGAFNAIPATLVRGAIYYLADGTYAKLSFTTPAAGTETVELRKAQSYDHCSSTGWNAATMGSAQAVFPFVNAGPIIGVHASYLTLNGNGTSTAAGCGGAGAPGTTKAQSPPDPSDCGIKIDNSPCTGTAADSCDFPIKIMGANITNLTLEYVETMGTNNNLAESMVIFQPFSGDAYNTFTHMFLHNAGCVYIQDGQQNETVTYSYFWGNNTAGSGCHGQASFSNGSDSDTTYANNVIRDINGTSVWTFAASSSTHDSWTFYNNVIWNDAQANGQLEDGIIACINSGTVCTNFMVMQNTLVNLNYSTGTVFNNPGGSITFENNLWYLNESTRSAPGGIAFQMGGSKLTEDYNSFLQSGTANPGTGAHDVVNAAAPNPFVNWTAGNFNLASEESYWSNRAPLALPFVTDPAGTIRSSDRGAYQYVFLSQSTPLITWPTPAAIPYGTALSATQLDAAAAFDGLPLPGIFLYSPASGTVLTAGSHALSVTFNPTDSTDYSTALASTTLVVSPLTQTVVLTPPVSPVTYGVSPISLSATGGASGNPVTFNVVSGPGSVSGNLLTITGAGTVVVAANQAGSTNYTAAPQVTASITVNQAAQTITFNPPVSPVAFGVSPIALSATGGASGNAVTFSVLSGPGTVSGSTLTVTGVGTVVIAANQAGNANYKAAIQVTQSIVVTQPSQTITFTAPASPVTFGVGPIALLASGGASGNPVLFSVLSGPGSISGSTLTILGAGTVVVAANQAGNASYPAAAQVTQSIVVKQAAQAIAFTAPASPVVFGVAPISLMASGGGSGNPVVFSIVSGPGTLVGSTLTVSGAGTIVVAANQAGNANYAAAAQATQSVVVNQAPQTITFTPPISPVSLGVAPFALVATGGPSGNPVTFSVLSGPATVSGSTLTISGAGTVLVAANQAGNANYTAAAQVTQSITVNVVTSAPMFTLVQKCHPVSHTSNTCTFPNNVTPGDLVIGGAVRDDTVAATGITDGAGNVFTLSPNSPCTGGAKASHAWLFYQLSSPGGANTNTVVFSDTLDEVANDMWVYEFKVTGGTAAVDTDANGCGATTTNANPTSTLTLSGSNELAYFVSRLTGGGATGVGAPWTLGALTEIYEVDGYDTSASSSITTAITPAKQGWGVVMAMAFRVVPSD